MPSQPAAGGAACAGAMAARGPPPRLLAALLAALLLPLPAPVSSGGWFESLSRGVFSEAEPSGPAGSAR